MQNLNLSGTRAVAERNVFVVLKEDLGNVNKTWLGIGLSVRVFLNRASMYIMRVRQGGMHTPGSWSTRKISETRKRTVLCGNTAC